MKPDITSYNQVPIIKFYEDDAYSAKPIKDLVWASEVALLESKIELEDDILGIIDTPQEMSILEWKQGITIYKETKSDPMNDGHQAMIRYWNFYLLREQNAYYRVRYNLMTIIGEVGGVMGVVTTVIAFLLGPCTYQKHELTVLSELEKKNNKSTLVIPKFASLKFILYDLKLNLRRLGLWPK